MKNKRQERLWRNVKKPRSGFHCDHLFVEGDKPKRWVDFEFAFAGKTVVVWWCHPQLKFEDTLQDMVWEKYPYRHSFNTDQKVFRKVGRSRKKVLYHVTEWKDDPEKEQREVLREEYRKEILANNELTVFPHCRILRTRYGLWIDLCSFHEFTSEKEVEVFAKMLHTFLRKQHSIRVPQMGYDCNNFNYDKGE